LSDEWLGGAGVVGEWVDESFAAACWAVGVGFVSGPAEFGAVGAAAGEGAECLFEPGDAAVEVARVVHVVLVVPLLVGAV
jgi:hypothetical protein